MSSPLFVRSLWLYILLLPSSWSSICRLRRSPLECLSHPALPSTCYKLQWTVWHCLGVIPSLLRPDCQLRAFNAEVTDSSIMALSSCSHSCPSTLVPSFGDDGEGCGGWRIVPSSQDTNCQGHDVPRRFLLVALGLSHPWTFSSSAGLLGLLFEMGRGTQILWPHNCYCKEKNKNFLLFNVFVESKSKKWHHFHVIFCLKFLYVGAIFLIFIYLFIFGIFSYGWLIGRAKPTLVTIGPTRALCRLQNFKAPHLPK